MNGFISSDNKVFTAAERKKIERLITNEYSECEGDQPTTKVEKEKSKILSWLHVIYEMIGCMLIVLTTVLV